VSDGQPDVPVFAVVGHPNKGKSSLVATLAQDDRVRIAPDPGTTTAATRYPMRVDGQTLYELVDTPGFQRARGVLAWLQAEAERTGASAAERPALVARFVATPAHRTRFADEVELLTPIVEGAGILYIVDGSVPYGAEYEAEMEVLRWTGRPSLAVINPIGEADHVGDWRNALGQYFRAVRVFDALDADFAKRLELLRAFGELEERFRPALQHAVTVLEADRRRRRERAAREVAAMLEEATSLVVERRIAQGEAPEAHRAALEEEFRARLRRIERRGRERVEAVYDFRDLEVEEGSEVEREDERALLADDLFSKDAWLVFGLRTRELVAAGAAAGAAAGGTLDVALGGASFLAGAALGSVVGGALGWWGGDRLAKLEVLRQPLGGTRVRYGPARGANLVAVLLGRARLHHALLAGRTHARRDRLAVGSASAELEAGAESGSVGSGVRAARLDASAVRAVQRELQRGDGPDADALTRVIEQLLG